MKLRELNLITDPSFYQYTSMNELQSLNGVELLHCLSLVRKEQRRLQNKVKAVGKFDRENVDPLDKENYKAITRYRKGLEQLFFDRQGYVPAQITESMLIKQRDLYTKTVKKYSK